MFTTNPFEILLNHDLWATELMLKAAAGLEEEKLHRRFEMGPGSVHDTLLHMIGAMRVWTDSLAGQEPRAKLEGRRSVTELATLLEEVSADFAAEAKRRTMEETITRSRGGKAYTVTRAAVLTHVATHGMHHRAQLLNMLRHLGVSPLPPSSVVEWTIMVDGK